MQVIFFDAFGTLCRICEKRSPYRPIIRAWASGREEAIEAVMTRNASPRELAEEAGCRREVVQEIEEGIATEIASMRLYPEVPALLETIGRRGLKWAVVSNLARPYAEPLLRLLPSAPDVCAWSFALGCRKPEERIYQHACTALGVKPSSVLMVGDSLENDYRAPKRLAMQARYLQRQGNEKNMPECVDDLYGILAPAG